MQKIKVKILIQVRYNKLLIIEEEIILFNWFEEKGKIIYEYTHSNSNIVYRKPISQFCDSDEFIIVQEHIFIHWLGSKDLKMTKKIREREMQTWFDLYGAKYEDLKFEDLITPGVSDSQKPVKMKENDEFIDTMDISNLNLHLNSDNSEFISYKSDKKVITFKESIFKSRLDINSKKIYRLLRKFKIIKMSKIKTTEDNVKINNKNIHRNKSYIKNQKSKEKYRTRKEESNCLLHALNTLSGKLTIRKHIDKFKNKNFDFQIKSANKVLKEILNKKLNYIETKRSVIKDYVKDTVEKSLIIFKTNCLNFHVEALENRKFIRKPQSIIRNMLNEKRFITKFNIIDA